MKKVYFLYAVFLLQFLSFSVYAQKDTLFWFVAPEILQNGSSNFDRPVFLRMTTYTSAATVTISQPASGGMPTQVVTIPPNSSLSFDLTPWINVIENKPANTILNYGLEIQSTSPITAYYHEVSDSVCFCNPEIFVLEGKNALGTDFWIPGQNYWDNGTIYSLPPTDAFDIVATENGTVVTITPSNNIVGYTAGATFTIALNKGQTYSATATSYAGINHLQGSRVTSTKPIGITIKDDLLFYTGPSCTGLDVIGDQIIPVANLGTEYIAMKGNLYGPPGEMLFVTATQNGTTLSQDGTYVTTLTAGQTYQLSVPGTATYIQTSLPAYVYEVTGLGCEISSALLPKISCTGSSSVSMTQSSTFQLYLNLLVKNGGQGNFLLNGASGVITSGSFSVVPGTGGAWYSAQVPLSTSTYPFGSLINVTNTTNLFQVGMLNGFPLGMGTSYGYFSEYGDLIPTPSAIAPLICTGGNIYLNIDTLAGATYAWTGPNGFSSTLQNPVILNAGVADSGTYTVTVTTLGCSGSNSISIIVNNSFPIVNLGPDITLCQGQSVTLQPSDVYISPSYIWNTGATTPDIIVSTGGYYWLQVTQNGCSASDTVKVNFYPMPLVDIGNDTVVCHGKSITLTAHQQANSTYLWSTGSTNSSINVASSGTYSLTVTLNGCSATDSIQITEISTPVVDLGADTTVCTGYTLPLLLNANEAKYLWSDGSVGQSFLITETGTYWATASNICGTSSDTINVTYEFCDIWFPSAFTPNGDGRNDIIRAVGSLAQYKDFSLSIYNRWGQRVFYTQDIYEGWDGVFNGTKQDLGTFFYMIFYTLNGKKSMMKGDIELIR